MSEPSLSTDLIGSKNVVIQINLILQNWANAFVNMLVHEKPRGRTLDECLVNRDEYLP